MLSRRRFLQHGSLALAALAPISAWPRTTTGLTEAKGATGATGPLGLPIGIQLYAVKEDAERDLPATLAQLAAIGYREVETAGNYGRDAKALRRTLDDSGIACPSGHQSMENLVTDPAAQIDFAATLGLEFLVCAFPWTRDGRFRGAAGAALARDMTLDDWKWNAEQLNRMGEMARKAGVRAAYHNHNMEFRRHEGVVAYDELLRLTDPQLVSMELDIAWVVRSGADPVAYLTKYADRISMLHLKDVRRDATPVVDRIDSRTTELGRGKVDWASVFAAARPGHLQHYFVEQEDFEHTALESARINFEYLRSLGSRLSS
jgi:sugar phosphate isomerase/epimerase